MEFICVTVEAPEPKKKTSSDKVRVWSCPICTYDNDESMTACDICGVIRSSVPGKFKDDKGTGMQVSFVNYRSTMIGFVHYSSL